MEKVDCCRRLHCCKSTHRHQLSSQEGLMVDLMIMIILLMEDWPRLLFAGLLPVVEVWRIAWALELCLVSQIIPLPMIIKILYYNVKWIFYPHPPKRPSSPISHHPLLTCLSYLFPCRNTWGKDEDETEDGGGSWAYGHFRFYRNSALTKALALTWEMGINYPQLLIRLAHFSMQQF